MSQEIEQPLTEAESNADIHSTYADLPEPREAPKGNYLFLLSLTALGVVFGDIGTSPLYALRECFYGPHSVPLNEENVLGVLSLIFWSLVIIVSIKYVLFVLRADNHGEGGILSLSALATPIKPSGKTEKYFLLLLGIFGASLLYGDGAITPSISVLSALEGINVAAPHVGLDTELVKKLIVPGAVIVLVVLFLLQRRGTAGIGKLFGPVMVLWFLVLAALGIAEISANPQVLGSINPYWAFDFFYLNGWHAFFIMGSVFLVVTGGEALYADMGHFGVRPIRIAWFALVLPSLMLNYFGQGALILTENGEALKANPFFNLAPTWGLIPLVVLATMAAIIASQAVISGSFSLTMQAIQLGLLPRMKITHTSSTEYGQIYLPAVNWLLMIGCIAIVISFSTSSNLAAAYGVAVTSAMVITTFLFYFVARKRWNWGAVPTFLLCGFFILIELTFFGANIIKFFAGGWFPLTLAALILLVMTTWKKGRSILTARIQKETELLEDFLHRAEKEKLARTPGTAVFMNGNATRTPPALALNIMHNHVLHERIIFVTVKTRPIPYVTQAERSRYEHLGNGFHKVKIYYGYMEDPNIPRELAALKNVGFRFKPHEATYFLGRETVVPTRKYGGMAVWREKLFAVFSRNAASATAYFSIPPDRVVELGAQIEI